MKLNAKEVLPKKKRDLVRQQTLQMKVSYQGIKSVTCREFRIHQPADGFSCSLIVIVMRELYFDFFCILEELSYDSPVVLKRESFVFWETEGTEFIN